MKVFQISDQEWDEYLLQSKYAEVFHSSFWKNAVSQFIGGKGDFFVCEERNKAWLMPCYHGLPWSTSFRLGSIGYGGPIPLHEIEDPDLEKSLFLKGIGAMEARLGSSCSGFTTFPLAKWGEVILLQTLITNTQLIELHQDDTHVFHNIFTGNVRTAIRRAEKDGLEVRLLKETEDVEKAYALLCETQEAVKASYVTPSRFFSYLCHSQSPFVTLWGVFSEKTMVAMSLLLFGYDKAFHLFHGWKRGVSPIGCNQLLIWKMIQYSISVKCETFNMGDSHQVSLKEAKKKWGAKEVPVLRGFCKA